MISIIISSYQEQFYSALEKNIAETIGVPYEIIKIYNPGVMGICEAYNKGATKAKYDYFLFIHEDIIFHTKDWGQLLINHLNRENTGVVGIAGSNYVPSTPIGWHLPDNKFNFFNYIQNNKSKSNQRLFSNIESYVQVFAVDGIFIGVKKKIYSEFYFDEKLKGFHGYDIDFSLRVAISYKNYIIHDILVEHFSEGNTDKSWFDNNIQVRKKIKHQFNVINNEKLEIDSFQVFLKRFFYFNKLNVRNFFLPLNFMPVNLKASSYLLIFKMYVHYIKNILIWKS